MLALNSVQTRRGSQVGAHRGVEQVTHWNTPIGRRHSTPTGLGRGYHPPWHVARGRRTDSVHLQAIITKCYPGRRFPPQDRTAGRGRFHSATTSTSRRYPASFPATDYAPHRAASRAPPQIPTPSPIMLTMKAVIVPTRAPSHQPAALPIVEKTSIKSFLISLQALPSYASA